MGALGAEIKELGKSEDRSRVDPTQRGADHNIVLTMQPARPGLAGEMGIVDIPRYPPDAKFGAGKSNRSVLVPLGEQCRETIMGNNGMFYKNNVGKFGAVSAGGNWGRLASAPHRFEMDLAGKEDSPLLLFSRRRTIAIRR